LVTELGLGQNVIFTGFRSDVPQLYRDLDVSVQASLIENLGGTIESLLMECPTVATRAGGLTDSVIDGITGILVNPADTPDLARGIVQMLRNPLRARALANAGRERMLARFTLSRTVADLDALYVSLARTARRYRPFLFVGRLLVAGVFCCGVALRFLVLDCWWLPRWDQGWRPWRPLAWTWPSTLLYRGYALVGRTAPSLSLRNKLATSHAMMMIRLRNSLYGMRSMPRMCLYRGYAVVGRTARKFSEWRATRQRAR
jgi:hypothetical protein